MIARLPRPAALRPLLPLLVLAAGGCSGGDKPAGNPADENAGQATATLAAVIARDPDISQTAQLLSRTGLAQALDGAGSYTMLTPVDDAFAAGDAAPGYGMAMLRRHILPGYITIADIEMALAQKADGTVLMRTLDGGFIRFANNSGGITATAPNGQRARLSGDQAFAANGVAIEIDRPLSAIPASPQ